MKKIWIYFSDNGKMWYPFNKENYLSSYKKLIRTLEDSNIEVYIVRWNSYKWVWIFNWYSQINNNEIVESLEDIKVDLIFNRDDKNTIPEINDCKIINHPEFDELCVDKFKTFERFPDISPKTANINSYNEYIEQIKKYKFQASDFIVLKKNFETEGNGIYIWEIWKVTEDIYDDWSDILFQEFIDNSVWIDGIVDWLHDLRITVVNWKPINSFIRTPKEWSYLANVAQWGDDFPVELDLLPKSLFTTIDFINKQIWDYSPILYSADFMNSKAWFKLVELNSRPALFDQYDNFRNAVADMLIKAVSNLD